VAAAIKKAHTGRTRQWSDLREQVAIAAGSGMTPEEIAIALGITLKRVWRDYRPELLRGAYQKRLAAVVALYKRAEKGEVAAIRLYLRVAGPAADVSPLPDTVGVPVPVPGPLTPVSGQPVPVASTPEGVTIPPPDMLDRRGPRPLEGWKEAANRAAQTAEYGTEWANVLPLHK
jgi:hypothetical protein